MEADDPSTCHVCFVKPLNLFDYSQIVKCTQCHLTCHKSCYNPSLNGDLFLCDLCTDSKKKPEPCFICGNTGLLKKVEYQFAHPICLLFNPLIIVTQYKTLQFSIVREQSKKDKKTKCSVCKKPGNLQKCFSKCNNQAHIYCILKEYHKAQVNNQERGWNHNPVVNALDYRFFFEKTAREYLSLNNPPLLPFLKQLSKAKHKTRQFELVCPDHTQSMFECCMDKKYFGKKESDPPIEYAQCEQCLKWYHQECLDKESIKRVKKQESLTCLPCQNFQKMLVKIKQSQRQQLTPQQKDYEIYLKELPRLNICELIYLQYLYEEKKYILSQNEIELMFHLPIEPSLIFIEQSLKKRILSELKTEGFEQICHLKVKLRMEKKEFKEKFTKHFQKVLGFLVGKNSLLQRTQDQEEQSEEQQKSEKILDEEERQKLKEWIQLLTDFKELYPEFDRVATKLIRKMNHWLKTLTGDHIKKQQESDDENKDLELQSEQQKIEEQQIISTKKQEPMSDLQIKSQQQEEPPERQQISEQIREESEQIQIKKIKEDQNDSNAVNTLTNKETFENMSVPFLEKQIEKDLLKYIELIKKKANKNTIYVDQAYQTLSKQHKNKTFTLDIILKPNLSSKHSTLKLLILEILFQNFLRIQENAKSLLSQSQLGHQAPQIIFNKDLLKEKHHQNIKYLQVYIQNLRNIYDEFNNQVKKQFNLKIQYLLSAVTNLITKHRNEILKLQNKLNIQEALNQYEKNPNGKNHLIKRLREQVGSSFDMEELAIVRIHMQKIEVYKKIKKVKFTNDCRLKMLEQYNDYCKSSSQNLQKESSWIEDRKKIDIRKEILAIQEQALKIWLDMYGAVFHLANQFITLEKVEREINSLEDGEIKQFLSGNKEPLQIIENILNLDFSTRQQDYKNEVFLRSIAFFSRLQKGKINYKIFHESLITVIQKLGQFCIAISFQNIQLWASKQENFKTVKNIYKRFRNSESINQNLNDLKDLFTKIWQVFQTDQCFESYLEENQKKLFDDPQFTHQLFTEKLPEMIKFYSEIGFVNRVQQLKTISVWIACYFRTLKEIGFERIFGDEFKDSQLRKKYQKTSKTTFNKINELVALLQKAKLPNSSLFIKKVINLYKEAETIELQVQKYFARSSAFIEKSMELKRNFLKSKSFDKHCIEYSEESLKLQTAISSEEFERLIETLSNNSLLDFVTWELEKRVIQNQRADFLDLTQKIEYVLIKSDTNIPIRDLNLMFFEVISYPFPYQNVSLLYLYIRQRVQRSNILSIQQRSISKKRKQRVDNVETIYRNLLDSLEPKQKMHFQNRLTRDQIMSKFNIVEQLPEFKQIMAHPALKEMRQKILDQIETFDGIKEDCQMIVQKINENKLLTSKEVLSLSESLLQYKQQRVFELGLELMYSQVEIYKLGFSPIPDTLLDMQVLLEQLRSLKPSFKTAEILKRMKDIELQISKKQGK